MKSFKQILGEARYDPNKFSTYHGPLMNASNWIGKRKLKDLVAHPEINGKKEHGSDRTMYVGHIETYNGKEPRKVALLTHSAPNPDNISSGYGKKKKGYNVAHDWYQDTGMGNKYGAGKLTVTGHVHMHPDGKVTTHGDVDMEKSHNLMVYK